MAIRWPFGAIRLTRRNLFKSAAAVLAAGIGAKWLADKFLAGEEPPGAGVFSPASSPTRPATGILIDVREFKKTMTVKELNATAEAYFARLKNWDFLLAKPLLHPEGTPALLNGFAQVLHGLQLLPGMTVLDFGAGSCWASRWFTQMGMAAIALDVSPTALKIGEALYARLPVIGERPKPRFLVFDGHRIELPDASVDRILCFDALHHLLNPGEVLREMSRILKPGGIAGFCEPGPQHSKAPQSQFEMRNFRVLEDDVHIREIWSSASEAGFRRMRVAVFSVPTFTLALSEFEEYLSGETMTSRRFAETTRAHMQNHRVFFLHKGGEPPLDSRSRAGLRATLKVSLASAAVKASSPLTGHALVTNSGKAIWLPQSAGVGGVRLGCHLLDASGKLLSHGYSRHPLTPGDGRPIPPGETVKVELRIPPPPKGRYTLEFELVSESVAWFSVTGSETARTTIDVD